jgi:DNA-binding GntR family transcriptional regulator
MGKSQYAEIVDTLVGDLAGCRPGARVASEHEIAARFTVSRAVAGAALRELETDPGRHVWLVESVNRDARRRYPVLTNIWWTRPDVIRVTVEMGNG